MDGGFAVEPGGPHEDLLRQRETADEDVVPDAARRNRDNPIADLTRTAWDRFPRSQALERALKKKPASWVSKSQHTSGEACDVEIPGMATLELARWRRRTSSSTRLFSSATTRPRGEASGWVHISLKAPGAGENRRALLSYVYDKRSAKYVYVEGLRASRGA